MSFIQTFKKIDQWLDKQTAILVLLFLIVLLRIPNFFEPYWYGDEAIYLSLGNALNEGGKLYTSIIDHKTPLIYYLARVPNQFYFRLLNLGWMLTTTVLFFKFAKKIFKRELSAFFATLIMLLLTTLPWLEGHIPNGELFVMGFVCAGALIFTKSSIWQNFFAKKVKLTKLNSRDLISLFTAGVFFSLGILTKVPALLDLAAFLAIFALILSAQFFNEKNSFKDIKDIFFYLLGRGLIFAAGIILPVLASILYFTLIGSGKDYLDYGLLYNIRYSQSWQLDLGSAFVNFSFSLLGKTLYLAIFVILMLLNSNEINKRFQFISIWFVAALYSVLLSSRPYPHYFMQLVPAFALLVVEFILSLQKFTKAKKAKKLERGKVAITSILLFSLVGYIMLIFSFMPYSSKKYYSQFFKMATGKISKEEYDNSFDYLVRDNRQVVKLINEMGIKKMFIWGTNPMLYAESKTVPTSRFTVSFHIKDFKDYDRTFAQISSEEPKLIVVMKNENYHFEDLENYLGQYYLLNNELNSMKLYLRK